MGKTADPHAGASATAREWRCTAAWTKTMAAAARMKEEDGELPAGVRREAECAAKRF